MKNNWGVKSYQQKYNNKYNGANVCLCMNAVMIVLQIGRRSDNEAVKLKNVYNNEEIYVEIAFEVFSHNFIEFTCLVFLIRRSLALLKSR